MKFRIDRIDRHADGRIRVIDYKTGAASSCEKKHLDPLGRPDALPLLSPALHPYTKRLKNGKLGARALERPAATRLCAVGLGNLRGPSLCGLLRPSRQSHGHRNLLLGHPPRHHARV